MDTPGYIVLSRMTAQMRATQVLANNLANANTPGYRAEREVFGALLRPGPEGAPSGGRTVAFAQDRATWRDEAPGPLQVTGNPLDLAIRSEGFFAVETPRGERYTRAGRFTLGPDGALLDMEGNPVLDARGTPIALAPNDSRIEILGDGTIRSESGVAGRLRVVRFQDPQALTPEGSRLFASEAPPEAVERPNLVQGSIEGSNVGAVQEMTRLIATQRDFETQAGFAESEGQRLSNAVDRILRRQG